MNEVNYLYPEGQVVGCVYRLRSTLFVRNVDVGWGLFASEACAIGTKLANFIGEHISSDAKDQRTRVTEPYKRG